CDPHAEGFYRAMGRSGSARSPRRSSRGWRCRCCGSCWS
ncbi:MAG: hypothetical protein AVDCRST_MAG88-1459, partial [uncultured Thermomicrobiales bacterium]